MRNIKSRPVSFGGGMQTFICELVCTVLLARMTVSADNVLRNTFALFQAEGLDATLFQLEIQLAYYESCTTAPQNF